MSSPRIGVLGPNTCTEGEHALGFEVGALIARSGGTLLCGGLGGMMAAAAEGARSEDGLTVGILPGEDPREANPYIDLALPTGLGAFRNALLVRACEAVVAIRGGYGTLSEIAFALRLGVPVVGLDTWKVSRGEEVDSGIHIAHDPSSAVELVLRLARSQPTS